MTSQPVLIAGDEMNAFIKNLNALAPCRDCGGQPALVLECDSVLPIVTHRVDCIPTVGQSPTGRHLRAIRGDEQ